MSKYVKELMMDQLKDDLGASRSVLIMDLKGLDANSENQLRLGLRKKQITIRSLKNTLARKVFGDLGMGDLDQFLTGPSVAVWGGSGIAELAKEVSEQVKKFKKPEIKGGSIDGTIISSAQVEDITKLPSREELIGRVAAMALAPVQRVVSLANAPASGLLGQLKSIAEAADESAAEGEAEPATSE